MKRKWLIIFIIIIVVLLIGIVASLVHRGERDAPVSHVVISGNLQHIQLTNLEARIKPLVENKDFFNVNLKQLSADLQAMPWVERAQASRVWPSTVDVQITEEVAQATWNQMGLINRYGEVFYPRASSFPVSVPNFYDANGQSALNILAAYREMLAILKPLKLHPTTIRVDSSNSWEVTLSNGIKLQLGTKDSLTKLQRFVKVYSKVFAKHSRPPHIVDMRYPNGMAVQWK